MQVYNMVFVGAGLSSSATLYHILSNLQQQSGASQPKKIAVIEKNGEFFKGIPYGNRSSVHSLTINPIKDFLEQQEQPAFFAWLSNLAGHGYPGFSDLEREVLQHWLEKNADKINVTDFDGVYIPRFLYGIYLHQKMDGIIAECKAKGLTEVDLITGEAIDTTLVNDGYVIEVQTGKEVLSLKADTLVLGTGSLDTKQINGGLQHKHLCIDDIYYPSLEINLQKLRDSLAAIAPAKRNILIIGANASASEVTHMLHKIVKTDADSFKKIKILATSGLPDRLYVNTDHDALLKNLTALELAREFTADQLMHAIKLDVNYAAEEHNLPVGKIHYSLSDKVVKMQKSLNAKEALNFFNNHGWSFTRITRRTSEDYYITGEELVNLGKLEFIKGRFVKLSAQQNNTEGLTFTYKKQGKSTEEQYADAFPIVINCMGAEQVAETSSKLYRNLLQKGICKVNHNGMGLHVDEDFSANKNLYIIGPLMAGIYNAKYKFWHLENAKRLNGLAATLAATIAGKD